ncbi:MAG: hypothetical protein ACLFQX_10135 [Candidatus Kapaibacterium sp.]
MENTLTIGGRNRTVATAILDLFAFTLILSIPAISHMLSFPVYLLEPMRIVLILAILHTSRRNAYMLAVALPLFSVLTSGHPVIYKAGLIAAELSLNVWLFYLLARLVKNKFAVMGIAIVSSKIIYYAVKFALISAAVLEGDLIATPLYLQALMAVALSGYAYLMMRNR